MGSSEKTSMPQPAESGGKQSSFEAVFCECPSNLQKRKEKIQHNALVTDWIRLYRVKKVSEEVRLQESVTHSLLLQLGKTKDRG